MTPIEQIEDGVLHPLFMTFEPRAAEASRGSIIRIRDGEGDPTPDDFIAPICAWEGDMTIVFVNSKGLKTTYTFIATPTMIIQSMATPREIRFIERVKQLWHRGKDDE